MLTSFMGLHLLASNTPHCVEEILKPALVSQTTDYTCGPTCVQSFLVRLGYATSEMSLAKLFGSTLQVGTASPNMVAGLKQLGFTESRFATELSLAELAESQRHGWRVILCVRLPNTEPDMWNTGLYYEHYVSLVSVADDGSIVVMDPDLAHQGYQTIGAERMADYWQGREGVRAAVFIK